MSMKKILVIILIIVLIIILGFCGYVAKNFMDITKLQEKYQEKVNISNVRLVIKRSEEPNITEELLEKGNKKKYTVDYNDGLTKSVFYTIGTKQTHFSELEGEKSMEESTVGDGSMFVAMTDVFGTESFVQKIYNSMHPLKSENYNGKDYYVTNVIPASGVVEKDCKIYINKDTGLIERIAGIYNGDYVHTYEYEFGKVTDKDFEFPDVSEYKN